MNTKNIIHLLITAVLFTATSCNQGPKVITPQTEDSQNQYENSTGIFTDENPSNPSNPSNSNPQVTTNIHNIKVLEVLPTDKYIYLRVLENDEEYWIATGKKEVEVGQEYFYKDGLLKTNFESKEYNRTFDKVYLVANIVPLNHGGKSNTKQNNPQSKAISPLKVEGSISIAEIVKEPMKYKGKVIQISGTCSKLNPNIMGRNWIHLKDGSKDDYDFVITSDVAVPEGHTVTMRGEVVLDKDFGAGYKYDIIIENGSIVNLK